MDFTVLNGLSGMIIGGLLLFSSLFLFGKSNLIGGLFFFSGAIILIIGTGVLPDFAIKSPLTNETEPIIVHNIPIDTIDYYFVDKGSGENNITNGLVTVFMNDIEINTVKIKDGKGFDKTHLLRTDINYRFEFTGDKGFYDYDMGYRTFNYTGNNNSVFSIIERNVSRVGIISDIVDETDALCGQTLKCYQETNTLKYNISALGNRFSFPISIVVLDSEIHNLQLQFKWNDTHRPIKNQYTSITFTCLYGDCGLIDTSIDYIDKWQDRSAIISPKEIVHPGTVGVYLIQVETNDIAIISDSEWYLYVSDGINAKSNIQKETIVSTY